MDAQLPKAEELSLPQAFLLLATNDKSGGPDVPAYLLRTTLAGAILAELDLIGAIELDGRFVRVTGDAPQTDLQQELDLIRHKSRPHTPKRWVSMLESRAEVQRVYQGMAAHGLVDHVGEKRLGLFRTVRYPEKDHAPEAALVQKIEAALTDKPGAAQAETVQPDAALQPDTESTEPKATGPHTTDPRTRALIALLHASGLLEKLFPDADRGRVGQLSGNYWPARAVEDELRMIRLAEAESAIQA
ncbi:GOLPH3/VPS74 family protein [Arthrobacter sp. HMWF013]|uniref:GOLPH3/VPS74 family protein n=1 Tax=Arthrobacter sp. HMWF013 TaxID=2056849 RepID=UPI000D3599E7|nr:GPP34 family phosphoprotein [Arthrobacter sp. HMWF013]PTT70656.1 GPP34 family phosphoprotein [Arthrobacter sp. HMWF013]